MSDKDKGQHRMIYRTPQSCFAGVRGYPFQPHFLETSGLRLHYLDEGEGAPILCLHGEPTWSYLYRGMIPGLRHAGRVIALDFPGFGKSDKYLNPGAYSIHQQVQHLLSFIEGLRLQGITLIVHDWGGMLGLCAAAVQPERFARLVILNTALPDPEALGRLHPLRLWKGFARLVPEVPLGWVLQLGTVRWLAPETLEAYRAPFPGPETRSAVNAFPGLLPLSRDDPGVELIAQARRQLTAWEKPALVLFSALDPFYRGFREKFRQLIPTAKVPPLIRGAGHFLQEDRPELITNAVLDFIHSTPSG